MLGSVYCQIITKRSKPKFIGKLSTQFITKHSFLRFLFTDYPKYIFQLTLFNLYYTALQNLPYAKAMNTTLVLTILDLGKFSKREIGEVKLPLCQSDLTQTIIESKIQKIHNADISKV